MMKKRTSIYGLWKILNLVLQLCNLSAILTVFFCGIVMSHYTWHNVTESSRVTTKYVKSHHKIIIILFSPLSPEKNKLNFY